MRQNEDGVISRAAQKIFESIDVSENCVKARCGRQREFVAGSTPLTGIKCPLVE